MVRLRKALWIVSVCNWTFLLLQHWRVCVCVCVTWENTPEQFCLKRPLIQELKPINLSQFLKYCLGNIKHRKHILALKQAGVIFHTVNNYPKKVAELINCSGILQFRITLSWETFPWLSKKGFLVDHLHMIVTCLVIGQFQLREEVPLMNLECYWSW